MYWLCVNGWVPDSIVDQLCIDGWVLDSILYQLRINGWVLDSFMLRVNLCTALCSGWGGRSPRICAGGSGRDREFRYGLSP